MAGWTAKGRGDKSTENRKKGYDETKYLGYTFYRYKGEYRFSVDPKSVAKMKADKIRQLTDKIME